ncbi:MAG: class I SAM-dependent methyltransferase [Gammaproteobacteria bacterium]|nr:class I SAM-dependent methyltransferase [Gammaproteobacteria bacterium]
MLTSLTRKFDAWKWRVVHGKLQAERSRFMTDPAYARQAAADPLYACVGDGMPGAGSEPRSVLELGCGDGKFVAMLAGLGYQVTGVDPIEYKTWKEFAAASNVDFKSGVAAEDLPFRDETFDAVACMGALLYFEDPEKSLTEIARVMKPGGRLVLRTVNRGNLLTFCTGRRLDPASRNLYAEDELTALLERHGLTVTRVFSFGFWPPFFGNLWWFAANTIVTPRMQRLLSMLTPRSMRVNWVVFAQREGSPERAR